MNKKPRKRYHNRAALLDAIDSEQHNWANSMKLVEAYEAEMATLRTWMALNPNDGLTELEAIDWHKKFGRLKLCNFECAIKRRSIPRHQANLGRLKLLLAEFDTVPMPWVDGSVVAR